MNFSFKTDHLPIPRHAFQLPLNDCDIVMCNLTSKSMNITTLYKTGCVCRRPARRSVACDNDQLTEPCSGSWRGQRSLTGHTIMSRFDVTVGHYYGQLITAAHASCRWPAAAPFSEHAQHARHRPPLGNHSHCPANDTEGLKVGLNKVSSR